MTHNTSKFQVGGGLESADIGVLVRGVKNENFPCPARLRALNAIMLFPGFYVENDLTAITYHLRKKTEKNCGKKPEKITLSSFFQLSKNSSGSTFIFL